MDEVGRRLTAQFGGESEKILAAFQKACRKETPFDLFARVGRMDATMSALTEANRKTAQGMAPAYVHRFR